MPSKGKRFRGDVESMTNLDPVPLADALEKVLNFKKLKFDQSVELCMHLGIDSKQADQNLRGALSLPHGVGGAAKRVVAFCSDDKIAAAKEAGAIEAGSDQLVERIEGGWMDFDVAVATPDVMRVIAKLGRVLGPRGLMPSPKSGTVTPDVVNAVKEYAAGKVEFRSDAGGNIHASIGKQSFDKAQLTENAQAFIDHIIRLRPSSTKGLYVKKITVAGTMTPGVEVIVD